MIKRLLPYLAIIVGALVVVRLWGLAIGFDGANRFYYDLWHQLAGQRGKAEHVVIVSIHDEDFQQYQDDPLVFWGPHFATAIGKLREYGVAQIGLDVLFTTNAGGWLRKLKIPQSDISRVYDIPIRRELAGGNVILAGSVSAPDKGDISVLLPTADYLYALPRQRADVGLTNLFTDSDGVNRRFLPAYWEDSTRLLGLSFPTLLAYRFTGRGVEDGLWPLGSARVATTEFPLPIGFLGPPGTIPRVSLGELMAPEAASKPAIRELKGKIAILAVECRGMQDVHLTPYSGGMSASSSMLMKGAEVQANIIETILTGRYPTPASQGMQFFFLFSGIGVIVVCVLWLPKHRAGAAGCMLLAGGTALSFLLFRWMNIVLEPAQFQTGVVASYLGGILLRLGSEERKRVWLQHTFGKYVSKEVVEQLLVGGCAPDPGGESRQVTVLFSDIRNFTTISEQLRPPEVMEMLNTYLERACGIIMARGGTVDKFIGDAVMAVFGSPCPRPDHPRLAVLAALDLAATAEEFRRWMRQRFRDRDLPEFNIGVGLHSGEVVVGNVGSAQRLEFTVLGDTVNLASRLEGLTKQLGWRIVASQATVSAVGQDVSTGRKDTVHVKGRSEPVEVFELLGLKERSCDV